MFVIVGLGNPGREYETTRHNIGFMTLDILAQRYAVDVRRHNFRSVFGEGMVAGHKAVLAKPETYMNESGWAVRDLLNWYKCAPEELIVIYDDADIRQGYIRVRPSGSAGTHNGMRSIVYQLGFDTFPRVRVGIGKADRDMVHYVLGTPQGEDRELLTKALHDAADAVEMIVRGELSAAQVKYNHKPPKPETPKETPDATQTEDGAQ